MGVLFRFQWKHSKAFGNVIGAKKFPKNLPIAVSSVGSVADISFTPNLANFCWITK